MAQRAVELAKRCEKAWTRRADSRRRRHSWEAFAGNVTAARQGAAAALELSHDRDLEYGAAFALALAGDASRAQTLADDLTKRFPEDTGGPVRIRAGHPRSGGAEPPRCRVCTRCC